MLGLQTEEGEGVTLAVLLLLESLLLLEQAEAVVDLEELAEAERVLF